MADRSKQYAHLERFLRPLVKLVYRPKVYFEREGAELSLEDPVLLVCNHVWHTDGTVINCLLRHNKIHHLAAKDRFEQGGFVKWYLEMSECIPIDRKGISTDWIHDSVAVLTQKRETVAIFPEGRHEKEGEILPFHSGAATLAALTGVPVVVLYINGHYNLFKRFRMMMSEPFHLEPPTEGMTGDYISRQNNLLFNKMAELKKRCSEL